MTQQPNRPSKRPRRRHRNINHNPLSSSPRSHAYTISSNNGVVTANIMLKQKNGTYLQLNNAEAQRVMLNDKSFIYIKDWKEEIEFTTTDVESLFASKEVKKKKSNKARKNKNKKGNDGSEMETKEGAKAGTTTKIYNFTFLGNVNGGVHLGQTLQSLSTSLTGLSLTPATSDHVMKDATGSGEDEHPRVQSLDQ